MYTLVLTVSTDFHLEIYYSVRNTRTPLGNNLDFSETLLYDHLLQVVLSQEAIAPSLSVLIYSPVICKIVL